MSGFETLPQYIDPAIAQSPDIPAADTAFAGEELDDRTALGLVLSDVSDSVTYLESKGLIPTGVDMADDLVRAYIKPRVWPDGKPKAAMPMYTVLESVEKIMPSLYMSLLGTGKT